MEITITPAVTPQSGTLVLCVGDGGRLGPEARDLDRTLDGRISAAMAAWDKAGAKGKLFDIPAPSGTELKRIILAGLGAAGDINDTGMEALGANLVDGLNKRRDGQATVLLPERRGRFDSAHMAAHLAFGARLQSYRFDRYRTRLSDDKKPTLQSLDIALKGPASARRHFDRLSAIADGVFLTRDVVSEPPNVLYPESYAERLLDLRKDGCKVQVLDETALRKLGMHSLLGVAQGSARPGRVVIMEWHGAAKTQAPLAFIGKGVTFDTGGISLKPGPGMDMMKWDMGGSGTVVGLMRALARRKAKVNAVGIVGLVENMPDGNAQRPGDIVSSLSGQTIEILNTDAEGRLVLCDVLTYAQQKYKPALMVDLATLTGAILVALGAPYAGLFSNDDRLSGQLSRAGEAVEERVWRLPLSDAYDREIDSKVADVKNIAANRNAGSIVAAQFLQRFVDKGVPWAHLDIAAVAWSDKARPTVPSGATGWGVRLLDRLVADNYEK
ncbi:MAG: leucyl aminopeptidase [Alphaproteobacteria bacterium]